MGFVVSDRRHRRRWHSRPRNFHHDALTHGAHVYHGMLLITLLTKDCTQLVTRLALLPDVGFQCRPIDCNVRTALFEFIQTRTDGRWMAGSPPRRRRRSSIAASGSNATRLRSIDRLTARYYMYALICRRRRSIACFVPRSVWPIRTRPHVKVRGNWKPGERTRLAGRTGGQGKISGRPTDDGLKIPTSKPVDRLSNEMKACAA